MRYVKVFEAWSEEKEEQYSHKDIYEMLEELVNAWKEWKENDDEDADQEELHDEFMRKVEDLIERAEEVVKEEEEEEEEDDEEENKERDEEAEEPKEEVEEVEETEEEVEESRDFNPRKAREIVKNASSELDPELAKFQKMTDLSTVERSLTSMLKPLIPRMDSMSGDEILEEFLAILDDPNLSATKATRDKNRQIALSMKKVMSGMDPLTGRRMSKTVVDKDNLMFFITNLHMRGSKLGSNPKDYRP